MTNNIRVPLTSPLIAHMMAELVTEDTDRPPYKAPAIPRDDHALNCPCPDCIMLRARQQRERLL